MKRLIIFCLLLVAARSQARHQKLDLQKALEMKLVKAQVKSLGGYQGYCTRVTLKNLTRDSLQVTVEAGRRLNSENDKYQDILIVKEELLSLKGGEEKAVKIKGYCCQSSNSAPNETVAYSINQIAQPALASLARFLNNGVYSATAEQQAIWALSDNKPTAGISEVNDSLNNSLKTFVAGVKGEKLPWYSLEYFTYVYPNGTLINHPLWLKGSLFFASTTQAYATLRVLNENGRQVGITESRWVNAGEKQDYRIRIPVKTLSKGKYTIELISEDKLLGKEEFEI